MKLLEIESVNNGHGEVSNASSVAIAKLPKLPNVIAGKDDLDNYLQRFQRFANINKWNEMTWSTSLSAILTGRAFDMYSIKTIEDRHRGLQPVEASALEEIRPYREWFLSTIQRWKAQRRRKPRAVHDEAQALFNQVG